VPEGKDLHLVAMNPVVKVVMNASKVDAPDAFGLSVQRRGSDSGLRAEQQKGLPQFFFQGPGGKRAISFPPSGSLVDVRIGSPGDPDAHGLNQP